MDLQNGYKVLYEKVADGERTFYASTTNDLKGSDEIARAEIGKYKLIYEKAGKIYGSETGIPAEGDYCFKAFDKVFCAHIDETEDDKCDKCDEDMPAPTTYANKTPKTVEEPVVEDEGAEEDEPELG